MRNSLYISENINLCDEMWCITDFAVIIRTLVGVNSKIEMRDGLEDDPQRRKPDITRAWVHLKWMPKVNQIQFL